MEYLDRTLATVEDNLKCEEALLGNCERTGREILHVWEPRRPSVVAGYSNGALEEIDLAACRRLEVPVVRRRSGGGTVVVGPGCLNYALILAQQAGGPLAGISRTNALIMERLRLAIAGVTGEQVSVEGHTDLVVRRRKFSGNAQYRPRRAVLFHGTVMLGMDIALIEETLAVPSRAPAYRQNRSHREFLTNLEVSGRDLKEALREGFSAIFG
jgi:lipoate-protein ligase A